MTEQFRAFLVVYIIAFPSLWFARIAFSRIVDKKELTAWLSCWLIVSLSSLILGNFWLYLVFLFVCIIGFSSKSSLAGPKIFFLLICAVPFFEKDISGFGVIERLMAIGHYKVLALTALLPIVLTGMTFEQGKFQTGINRIVIALILLASVLFLRATTLTDSLREAVNMFAVIYLPYFAMSRALTSNRQIRELMVAFLLPMIGIALLGVLEVLEMVAFVRAPEQCLGDRDGELWIQGKIWPTAGLCFDQRRADCLWLLPDHRHGIFTGLLGKGAFRGQRA